MSQQQDYLAKRTKSVGDIAVDGLLAGLTAGLVMGVFLVVVELIAGVGVVEALARFDPGGSESAATGALFHLAVSALYGVVGALVYRTAVRRSPKLASWGWLLGGAYGLLLWLLAQFVLVPGVYNTADVIPPLLFALAHLLFGLVLGLLLTRLERDATEG